MRKTFKLFCAAALAALAVSSCYDDSFLKSEIDRLDNRVDSLASVLNKDVANLAALQSTVTNLETSLKKAIADGDAAVKKALEDALAAAEADIAAAIAAGDKAVADALAAEKAKIEAALKALETGLGEVTSDVETLETALKALEATVGANYKDLLKKLDEVDGVVDGHIADMKTALDALAAADEKINKELVAAVAKIAVVKVEEVSGKIVLTLADGKTVELSKPLSNVDNKNLVTIVEVDGVKYWAVVGADGTAKSLEIPVEVAVEFQINSETNELEATIYGGKTWVETGIVTDAVVNADAVITDFEESDDYVTITIGGTEIVLPKYAGEFAVNIKVGKQYFKYGVTKIVEVSIADVTSTVVMTKPDGWKANINGSKLTITAPDSTKIATGFADVEGQVVLHGNTADGRCKTAILNVAVGSGFELTIDAAGRVNIVNPIVVTKVDPWMGWETTDFADAIIGICTVEEFASTNIKNLVMAAMGDAEPVGGASYLANIKNNLGLGSWYEEGVYEVDKYSVAIDSLGMGFWPVYDIKKGGKYVVWAVPQVDEVLYDDAVYAYYEPVVVEVAETISWNEIELAVSLYGTEEVYAGVINKTMLASFEYTTVQEYLELGYGHGGPWAQFKEYGFEAIGQMYEHADTVSVSELAGGLLPNETYYVWLFPKKGNKAPADYDYDADLAPYIFEYTTDKLVAGAGNATLTEGEKSYTEVSVNVKAAAEGTVVYYKFYEDAEAVEEMTDEEIIADVLSDCYYPLEEEGLVTNEYLSDGQSVTLVALSVTADGKYSIVKDTYTTLKYPIVDNVTVTVESVVLDSATDEYTVVFNVTGDVNKVAVYNNYSSSYSSMVKYVVAQNTTLNWGDVVDGKATVKFKNRGSSYMYAIYSACKVTDDAVVALTKPASKNLTE